MEYLPDQDCGDGVFGSDANSGLAFYGQEMFSVRLCVVGSRDRYFIASVSVCVSDCSLGGIISLCPPLLPVLNRVLSIHCYSEQYEPTASNQLAPLRMKAHWNI